MRNLLNQEYRSLWDAVPFSPNPSPSQQNGMADGSKIKPSQPSILIAFNNTHLIYGAKKNLGKSSFFLLLFPATTRLMEEEK